MKKYSFIHTLSCLYKGQTLTRIYMNTALSEKTIKGHVVDIGGGRRPDYFQYFKIEDGADMKALDGSLTGINFEKDRLPYQDSKIDTIILCNVLEHIYDYRFLLRETYRIMKPGAELIGFVPFWVGYHPDPKDYFRYTDECLHRIFEDIGFRNISVIRIGSGPILANFNTICLSIPKITRPVLFLPYYLLDSLFIKFRPKSVVRNPFGYVFTAIK